MDNQKKENFVNLDFVVSLEYRVQYMVIWVRFIEVIVGYFLKFCKILR